MQKDMPADIPKLGRPFVLPKLVELRLVKYIIEMQELGFGPNVTQIKQLAFQLSNVAFTRSPFNGDKAKAGSFWWWSFKQRYVLSLDTPEKLAASRAVTAKKENIEDFYDKLESTVNKLQLQMKPGQIYNCDGAGVTFVVKPSRIVTQTGKKDNLLPKVCRKGRDTNSLGML
jgi:hypothetical protein